jgi:hypothetical protein
MTGSTFNNTGNFPGAILNQDSTVTNTGIMAGGAAGQPALADLMAQLAKALNTLPPAHAEDVEAIKMSSQELQITAQAETPSKPLLRSRLAAFGSAVKSIGPSATSILSIGDKIVDLISKIHGLG